MTTREGSRSVGVSLVAALCLALGACNTTGATMDTSLEASVPAAPGSQMQALAPEAFSPSSSATTMAPAGAVASLPGGAGAVAAVRGRGYVDGFRQDIILKGGAVRGIENGITVLARTSARQTLDERVPLSKPSEAAIRSEIGRAFPHIAMQVVERPSSNRYGSYGMALGRSGDTVRCVYMWQWIDAGSLPREVPGPMSIRVRLCKAGTTFDALAASLDHLTIQRDSGGVETSAIVDPPSVAEKPRLRVARHVARRPQRIAAAHEDDAAAVVYAPAAAGTMTYPQAAAVPRSSVDLPPQAFLGPGARP